MRAPALLPGLVLLLTACAGAPARPPRAPSGYGRSREQAVELCLPPGENGYLKLLTCPGGSEPKVVSRESVGPRHEATDREAPLLLEQLDAARPLRPGERDLHIVDRLLLACPAGDLELFLDMYHCGGGGPLGPPEGLGLRTRRE
jgi:hypothetical protein